MLTRAIDRDRRRLKRGEGEGESQGTRSFLCLSLLCAVSQWMLALLTDCVPLQQEPRLVPPRPLCPLIIRPRRRAHICRSTFTSTSRNGASFVIAVCYVSSPVCACVCLRACRSRCCDNSEIERDEEGNPILPFMAKGAQIQCLGQIVWDQPAFHQTQYLYPVGFRR